MIAWSLSLTAMVLVLVRISGLMVFAPVLSSEAIPMRVKAAFVLSVSVLVAPVVAQFPGAQVELSVSAILGELSVGLVFGMTLSMIFEALQFAGQIAGFQFSFSLVNLLDPNAPVETPLMGQLFTLLGTLTVIGAGLDRTLLMALLRTFSAAPLGAVSLAQRADLALIAMASGIFAAALQLCAPLLAATLLAEVAVALAGKLAPALPVMAMTIPIKTLLGYAVLIACLAVWPHWIEARFVALLNVCGHLWSGTRGA